MIKTAAILLALWASGSLAAAGPEPAVLARASVATTADAAAAADPAPVRLELKRSAEVAGDWVRLGDVAQVSAGDAEKAARLANVKLSHVPLAGAKRLVSKEDVVKLLRRLGVDEEIRFAGEAQTCTVSAAVKTIPGEDLLAFGREFLKSRISHPGGEVTIQDPDPPTALVVPAVETSFQADVSPSHTVGLVPVTVEVWSEGKRLARRLISYRVNARVPVVHAARDLKAGEVIGEEDLSEEMRDLASLPRDVLTRAEQVMGQRLLKPLSAGAVMRDADLARPLMVKQGAQVVLVARVGPVEARAEAQARQAGGQGDIITVMNSSSKRLVRARIVGKGVVEAALP